MVLDLAVRDDDVEGRAFLHKTLLSRGADESAIRYRWAGMLWVLGNYALLEEKTQKALILFTKAIAIKPDFADAHMSLGDYYYEHISDVKKSLYHYRQVLALGPDDAVKHATAYYNIGRIYQVTDVTKNALVAYNKAIDLVPKNSPAIPRFCRAYEAIMEKLGASPKAKCQPFK
jgi:tetratricopeptide (TPR) repeat protein